MKNRKFFQIILTILTITTFIFTSCNKEYHELPKPETTSEIVSTYNANTSDGSASSRSECQTGDVLLNSQAAIDNFIMTNSNCSIFEGNLRIQLPPIPVPLSFLQEITGNLIIEDSPSLESLEGLHNIISIGGDLIIDNNNALINLSGLESLESIGGSFEVINNAEIEALSFSHGPADYWWRFTTNVKIQGNPQLSTCAIEGICEFLDNGGQATISNNAQGCNSVNQVKAECASTMDCGTFAPRTWVSNRQQHSVKINWDAVNDADLYKVRYRKKNSNNVWKVKPSSGSNLTLNALQSNTNYEYQHKYQCSSGWSNWANLKFFKTKV